MRGQQRSGHLVTRGDTQYDIGVGSVRKAAPHLPLGEGGRGGAGGPEGGLRVFATGNRKGDHNEE